MAEKFIQNEATGVYIGTLQEDMIETVAREKKLYCDVLIPDLFSDGYNYPLTYVPLWALSLPLRKGDKVMVQFNQNDYMYPMLYKNPTEIESQWYEKFELGSANNLTLPKADKTVGVTKLGENSYILKTDSYTIIHQNNAFVLIDSDNNIWSSGKTVNIISSDSVNVDSKDVNIYASGNVNITSKLGVMINNHLKVNP